MVNKNPPPDERVVYLALKNVFKGQDAGIRQSKAVKKLVQENKEQENVASLLRDHGLDVVCNAARTLLVNEIFASTLKAKIRFPELFDLSPTQTAEREASEAEAARYEASAIENAVKGRQQDLEPSVAGPSTVPISKSAGKKPMVVADQRPHPSENPSSLPSQVPPLFPIYLPLNAQHRVLTHLQKLLEFACYQYGRRAMTEALKRRVWDCAEAGELNLWAEEFRSSKHTFPGKPTFKTPLNEFLTSIANIRHTAVHRIRVSAKSIEQFLLDAEALAGLLRDSECIEKIQGLRRHTVSTIEELQRNQQFLRSKLGDTLRGIEAQREELKRLEEAAVTEMEEGDAEYKFLASKSIGEALGSSEASFSTAPDVSETDRKDTMQYVHGQEDLESIDDDWASTVSNADD